MSYPKADPIGLRVLKWLVVLILAVAFLGFFIRFGFWGSTMMSRCQEMARDRGYLEATYVPGRSGSDDRCICSRKRNPDGTIDENDSISIPMENK